MGEFFSPSTPRNLGESAPRLRLSRQVRIAIRAREEPAYAVAMRAGLDPSVLSKLIHGAVPIQPDDPRVRRLAKLLGVPPADALEEITA